MSLITRNARPGVAAEEPPPVAAPRRRTTIDRGEARTAWGLMTPSLLLLLVFYVVPIVSTGVLSLTDFSVANPWKWVGLANYREALTSDLFWQSMWNTTYFTAGSVVPSIAIGLFMAVLLNSDIALRPAFRLALYAPALTSLVAAAMMWIWLYDPQTGLLNAALKLVGIHGVDWLTNSATAMPALIVMNIWRSFGFCMLVYLGGLQSISSEVYEAAALDGAGWWRTLVSITLPLLNPMTLFLVITQVVSSFQAFEAIFVMTSGGPNSTTSTVVFLIYKNAFQFMRMGYASAMALLLFVVLLAVSIANGLVFHRKDLS